MIQDSSLKTAAIFPILKSMRFMSGCMFIFLLSLTIKNPFEPVVGMNSNCEIDLEPATLIFQFQSEAPTCRMAAKYN